MVSKVDGYECCAILWIGSSSDLHPSVIKTVRTSDYADGVCVCVDVGDSVPGITDSPSTRWSIGGCVYAIDVINVVCMTSHDTYVGERLDESRESPWALWLTSFEACDRVVYPG